MFRKVALTVCLVSGCIWCVALVTRADSAGRTQPGPTGRTFRPVASVESLMHGQKTFFKEIGAALEKTSAPKEEDEHGIDEAAEVLAELANVNRYNNDKEDYRAWATTLRDTALELAGEAKKKEADHKRLRKLYGELKDTCIACHDVYQ